MTYVPVEVFIECMRASGIKDRYEYYELHRRGIVPTDLMPKSPALTYKSSFHLSPEAKAYQKAYQQSPKWKAYRKSPKAKEYRKAYRKSPKAEEYRKAYRQLPEQIAYHKAYYQRTKKT